MAEPRLTLVDQVFEALPDPVDDAEKKRRSNVKAVVAKYIPSAIKLARPAILEEGRLLALRQLGVQRIEEASQIAEIKAQHAEQLKHTRELWGRGERWQGRTVGLVLALLAFAGGMWTGKLFTEQGFAMQIAAQRVPRAAPTLQYEQAPEDYQRDRREPADAP